MIPYVIEETESGEKSYDLVSRLLRDRIIYLGDEVNKTTAGICIMQMLYLEAVDPNKDIYLYINSPGGVVTAGMAIYDTMRYISCDVCTICVGLAASMGSFILAGGTKGKRYALKNAEIMIHQPSGGADGQATDIKIAAEHIIQIRKKINRILAENTNSTIRQIEKDTERDYYMSSEKALEYGIIDKILENRNELSSGGVKCTKKN